MTFKTIHDVHHCFDHSIAPVETISSGDTRHFDILDASGGLIARDSKADIISQLPHDALNPVCGPLFIEDAEPGDVIEIELLDFEPGGWGWTALIPGFGLLAEDFTTPWLKEYLSTIVSRCTSMIYRHSVPPLRRYHRFGTRLSLVRIPLFRHVCVAAI